MIKLPQHATDQQILDVIRDWVELLAQNHYEDAFQMLKHDASKDWSPELIRTVISNYGFIEPRKDEKVFRVTSIKEKPTGKPYQEVDWYGDDPDRPRQYLGMVLFNLPLNGEWSDVTAVFDIVEEDDHLALELDDIHVL
jgi:hypothetical protein